MIFMSLTKQFNIDIALPIDIPSLQVGSPSSCSVNMDTPISSSLQPPSSSSAVLVSWCNNPSLPHTFINSSCSSQAVPDTSCKSITITSYPTTRRKWLVDSPLDDDGDDGDEDLLDEYHESTHEFDHMTNPQSNYYYYDDDDSDDHTVTTSTTTTTTVIQQHANDTNVGTLHRIRLSLSSLSRPRSGINDRGSTRQHALMSAILEQSNHESPRESTPQKPMKIIRKKRRPCRRLASLRSTSIRNGNSNNTRSEFTSITSLSPYSSTLNDVSFQRPLVAT
ncbi:hypothetical protein BDF22DRAFT_678316 [Syncephalis plumigaleata]|nr:hypothetical protein BDF22DRAFT_678316 [Syncephalis plumigaleata]